MSITAQKPGGKAAEQAVPASADPSSGKHVLVFQGGGALGAYQAGCYQALSEAGMEPDWVIGTSIGAINAGVIAGNPRENRLPALRQLWQRLGYGVPANAAASIPGFGQSLANLLTMATGLENFFTPNPAAFANSQWPLGAENAGYYSTSRLRTTLRDLIDFDRVNACSMRLTVGAANVGTGNMRYFDSKIEPLDIEHIMASGALPPAFPAVQIGGQYYWDGGVLSNTPVEVVFDDNPRESALVFVVHVWNPSGPPPATMQQVLGRMKEVQYASRAHTHIGRQKQLHRLRHIIGELAKELPEQARSDPRIREMAAYGCLTKMHIVRLLAPMAGVDDHTKDIDFNPVNIQARWQAGYNDMLSALRRKPWLDPGDPLDGFVLHEVAPDHSVATV
jgi:NTE family protein